ncbi:MAG: nitronate monooxygenase [Armatimonadetes bacterium]|nr:nitronate monooxygenase [Armatimonadota bacterium]
MLKRPTPSKTPQSPVVLSGIRLSVPVVQAILGDCDSVALAVAVSRAGGLGTLSVNAPDPAYLKRRLKQVRSRTPRPVLLAFTASFEEDAVLDTALQNGFRAVQVFWWNGPRIAPRVRREGGTVFWQIGTVAEARDAVSAGADVVVAQGTEAGGQVRSPRPVLRLIRELREALGEGIPIVAGGGFADKHDTQAALEAGANAAMFGTRFLLSDESNASPRDKTRLLRATADHLQLDSRLVGDWPCCPRRRLRTATDEEVIGLYAGLGIGRVGTLLPAGQIVRILAP